MAIEDREVLGSMQLDRVNRMIEESTKLLRDSRGITGLETAIVLIAFVVVASVFAFAVLSTGLLSSEKAKTTVAGGIEEGGVGVAVKGSIIAHESSTVNVIERLQIPIISVTDDPVDLSATSLVVTYIDANQVVDLAEDSTAPGAEVSGNNPGWTTVFRAGDTGPVLDTGERTDFWIKLSALTTQLGASTQFTVQIKPSTGAVLEIQRTTPGEITAITNLN